MNQNKNFDNHSSDICQKMFRAISRIAWGEQAPYSAQSGADPPVIQSKPEGGGRIALVLENGEGKSSTSDFPDNQVAIVAARTEPVKTPGHQGPGQSANIAAVAVTQPGLKTDRSDSEVMVTHGERPNKPKVERTSSVDQESQRNGHDMDHRFTDYINRTWLKIRSLSNVGGGKTHSPTKDTRHDHFAEYITTHKKKLRTTSSIGGGGGGGGGRGFSFK